MGWVSKLIFLLCLLVVYGPFVSRAQQPVSPVAEERWKEGKVTLTDNTVFEGEICFQENFDLLKVKTAAKVKTFTAKQVKHFTYGDGRNDRFVISIPYNPDKGAKEFIFFEVIKETKDLALLSRNFNINRAFAKEANLDVTPFTLLTPYNGAYNIPGSFGPTTSLNYKDITNRETLFLANDEGMIEPFVVISYKDVQPDKCVLLNKSLMREFFGKKYSECKKFADLYNLDLKEKEDLIALLNYYERIGR